MVSGWSRASWLSLPWWRAGSPSAGAARTECHGAVAAGRETARAVTPSLPPIDPARRRLLGLSALFALGLGGCASTPVETRTQVPRFSRASALDALPSGWLPYALRRDLPRTDYRLVNLQGRRVLHAAGTGV